MSAPREAKTAALEALIEAHATELKLPTVKRRCFSQRLVSRAGDGKRPFIKIVRGNRQL